MQRTKEWTGIDPSRTGYSDGVVLEDLEHKTGAVWDGPLGTRIPRVRFVDNQLIVSVYGNLQLGSTTLVIQQQQPEDYIVPWPKDSKPSAGSLYDSILARHQGGDQGNGTIQPQSNRNNP